MNVLIPVPEVMLWVCFKGERVQPNLDVHSDVDYGLIITKRVQVGKGPFRLPYKTIRHQPSDKIRSKDQKYKIRPYLSNIKFRVPFK